MKRLILMLLALCSVPALGQYQYYGTSNGSMGAMPSLPPAPPPAPPPTYPSYGADMSYGSTGYTPMPDSGFGSSGGSSPSILSYGFLEAGYQFQKPKDSSLDGAHGIGISLSAQLFKPLFINADFGWTLSNGKGNKEYDFTSASLGAGLYLPIVSKFHFVAEVGGIYGKLDAKKDSLSFTEGAVYARPALRFAPVEFLEFQAGVTVTSSDSFDSMVFDVGGYFRIFSQLDLGLNVDLGDGFTGFTGGIRFRW